jgi:hypothetical protein
MLHCANAGCVLCVRQYVLAGGDPWKGCQNDPVYNAWRASYEHQSLEVFPEQEAVRVCLKTLRGSEDQVKNTEKDWNDNKLLDSATRLRKQLLPTAESLISHSPVVGGLDEEQLLHFHKAPYEGKLDLVISILKVRAEFVWRVAPGPFGETRASDWARLGRHSTKPSIDTMNYLLRLEEPSFRVYCQNSGQGKLPLP